MSDTESLEEIEAIETKKQPIKSVGKPVSDDEKPKAKKPRTEAQIKAFERCLELKKEKAKKRNDEAKRLAEYDKKALEEKVVAKAISIKKKQIKKQIALDEISDDDAPIEVIKSKPKAAAIPTKLVFNFI